MPDLIAPDGRVHRSFLEAVTEFRVAGEDHYTGLVILHTAAGFPGEEYTLEEIRNPLTFARFAGRIRSLGDPATPLPEGIVLATKLWWVDADEYLGQLSIRHELTDWLRNYGGHIGYSVRPSVRRRGHATAMLQAALPVAYGLGIDPALVTCDDTNVASRRTIEANGGVLDDQREQKLRYWVPTSPTATAAG